ncbi:uncharacterized protein LTR77_000112 [Saxophila tyrrhenica]|uniref:CAP-Gly domain-containing protein n=1 Tax=Saxophila tyrrhenica TaxID=1690608 RepID=A0AAV9PME7_9PEZI|nr:hypothetical protein LTR77_000112 [Saxophila tyrrhenica]
MSAPSLKPGQQIELNDGRIATVRFVGNTSFQTGEWVGVELGEATGKNDGSVKGERYFQCQQGYGMFLRPAGVRRVVEDVKPKTAARGTATAGRGRPSGVQPGSGVNGTKRQSMIGGGGSPTPGARGGMSGIRSPVKSPTKQLGSNGVSSTSTSRTSTPPVGRGAAATGAAKPRPSLGPSSTTAGRRTSTVPSAPASSAPRSRQSLAAPAAGARGPSSRPAAAGKAPASRAPAPPADSQGRLSSTTEEETNDDESERPELLSPKESETSSQASLPGRNGVHDDADDTITQNFAPPPIPPDPEPSPTSTRPRRPSSPTGASIHSQKTIRSTAASKREIEELEAKVRLLERKRLEDRDVKKNLEKAQQERDQYKGIIEKLQTKYKPQQQEIADLKQALSELEKKGSDVDAIREEYDTALDMAAVDREMAEEAAENLKADVDALRAQNEEMQLELEILREENGELTKEMGPEERESAGVVQLQASNDRLRNALLALRDRSLDEKEELQEQMKSLEDQVKDLDKMREDHEEVREKLLRSEANTDDLRQQLEAALEAEEMIEQLTERNNRLDTVNAELRDAIEDLEDLKEVNDELETNHVETEKQMQDEIEFKDSLLQDRERMAQTLQDALDDRNQIINQFRSFVSGLQTEMADMKASKEISETEAKQLEGKSRAMLDLNLKLQNSAAKTQVKTIDLELRKLDAQEASEHLAIVQLFLPEAFHTERDSVLALLRFKRIGFKANLVHGFVKERIASFGSRGSDEDVFPACDVLDKLTWIAAMAGRFVNSICSCSVEEFTRYDSALYELEPVERALNSYIDGLRREDLRERDMAQELQRSIAVMSHLASLHVKDDLASHADHLLMRTQCLQSQLESAATALQLSRGMIETYIPKVSEEDDEDDEGSASDLAIILTRADSLVNHVRSAKVMAGKAYRALEDLQERSLTLEVSHSNAFENTESVTTEVTSYTRQAGDALQSLFGEEGRNELFTPTEVASALSRAATSTFALQAPEAGPFSSLANRLRDLTNVVTELVSLPTDLDNTVEFERAPAPWVARANELKQTKITSIDTEAELARTVETLHGKEVVIREKETELEEQSVRIEMLEARMKDASKRSAKIAELERNLRDAKDAERRAKQDLDKTKEEKDKEIERIREETVRTTDDRRKRGSAQDLDSDAMGTTARLTMRRQEHKIVSLEGAVRFLKSENHRLRLPSADSPLAAQSTLDWLHQPFSRPKTETRKRKEGLQKDSKDVLQQMLALAARPQAVDLTKMPDNKLAWRPAKETSRWRVEKRKEEWEGWKGWQREVVAGVVERGQG